LLPTVEIDEDGIFVETHVDEFVTVNLAMYVAEERKRLTGKAKKPLLVLIRQMVGFDPATRDYTDQILANVSALGFYINCETEEGKKSKEIMEGFYRVTPYPIPVGVFDNKEEVLSWLKQYV